MSSAGCEDLVSSNHGGERPNLVLSSSKNKYRAFLTHHALAYLIGMEPQRGCTERMICTNLLFCLYQMLEWSLHLVSESVLFSSTAAPLDTRGQRVDSVLLYFIKPISAFRINRNLGRCFSSIVLLTRVTPRFSVSNNLLIGPRFALVSRNSPKFNWRLFCLQNQSRGEPKLNNEGQRTWLLSKHFFSTSFLPIFLLLAVSRLKGFGLSRLKSACFQWQLRKETAKCVCGASLEDWGGHSHSKCTLDSRMSQYRCCFISMSICVSWTNWQVKWAISLLIPCVTPTVMNLRKW